jgi:hypothetical protein
MIKPVDEIPMNIAKKRESYRDQIRSDIHEAMDKGIKKFEFVGDYKFKYLAQYAREEADRIIRNEYIRLVRIHKDELENVHCDYYAVREKIRFITVTSVKGEDKDKPRVFCEIAEKAPEDIIMDAIHQYDRERKELEKARAEREEKRRKLRMKANDKTESFDFSEELP